MKKDLLSLLDLSAEELQQIIVEARHLKKMKKEGIPHELLKRKSLAMIFEKPSTRTRLSFEVGMHDLGGACLAPELPGYADRKGGGDPGYGTCRIAVCFRHHDPGIPPPDNL